MARTGGGGQTRKIRGAGATILALVFGFLGSLIQGMFALVRARRMARAGRSGQAGNAGGFGSAIFTVIVHG